MKEVVVVIPIYKAQPTEMEYVSLRQTLLVLGRYDIAFVCPSNFDSLAYDTLCKQYKVDAVYRNFAPSYFESIQGYNRLLLSESFYQAFSSYEYMLICQPDAYVFSDELQAWCKKGYDYIGAPLVGHFTDTEFSNVMRVGNGGFSLRKIAPVLSFFQSSRNVFTSAQIARKIQLWKKPYTRIFVWALMMIGWRNKPRAVADHWNYNEDDFWSGLLDDSRFRLHKPDPNEAISFAFERFPSELYELNGSSLPFGCHAWEKYQYQEFWKEHMPNESR